MDYTLLLQSNCTWGEGETQERYKEFIPMWLLVWTHSTGTERWGMSQGLIQVWVVPAASPCIHRRWTPLSLCLGAPPGRGANKPCSLHKALGSPHWGLSSPTLRGTPLEAQPSPAPCFYLFPKACWDKTGKQSRGKIQHCPDADLELELCQCSHSTFPRAALGWKINVLGDKTQNSLPQPTHPPRHSFSSEIHHWILRHFGAF